MLGFDNIYRWIGFVLLLIGGGISRYFRSRADQSGEEISPQGEGALLLTLRRTVGLGMWLSVLVYLINPRWMAWSQFELPEWVRWSAVGIMSLCLPLLYWMFRSLNDNVTPTVAIREEHQLVTGGPYRWIRHPLYTFGFVFFISFSLMAANGLILVMTLLTLMIIMARTPIEEERLLERFGEEYREYMQRTGRYLPRIRPWKG